MIGHNKRPAKTSDNFLPRGGLYDLCSNPIQIFFRAGGLAKAAQLSKSKKTS